jgi:hypothetical protein
MEGDWEFEVGGDAPVIDACWPGFVDLQVSPERARDLPEAVQLPSLAAALEKLNSRQSPVWTSKCDFWPVLQSHEFDLDELDSPIGCFTNAMGCYIDLLPKGDQRWPSPAMASAFCRDLCSSLRAVPFRCCRVDLVIRRALIAPDRMGTGVTAYIVACGAGTDETRDTLGEALAAFVDALCSGSRLQ